MTMGIDVAKAHLDVVLLWPEGREAYRRVANTAEGHEQLWTWLRQQTAAVVAVCLEATGRYGEAVAQTLYQRGCPVSIVNPASVKHFAAALMKRQKTDKSDAQVLARYQAQMEPSAWQPPRLTQTHLQDLKRLADDLQTDHTRVKNRLEGLRPRSPAQRYLEEQLRQLEEQLAQVEQEIQDLVLGDDQLQTQYQLLTSITGIGGVSAVQLLAELPDVSRFETADQLVAYAGLCPYQHQSGQQPSQSWLSKQGSGRIRKALYFPALSAKQHNPHLRPFAERLRAAGKAKMTVVVAVMRKLLVLAYTILKSGRPYDKQFGFSS
jgi:transposase